MEYLAGISLATLIIFLIFYFLPSIIALFRGKSNSFAIIILNIFLGWTFIGWVVALVWSFTSDQKNNTVVINNNQKFKNPKNLESNFSNTNKKEELIKSHRNSIKKLNEIKNLLDKGILTQDEFAKQKSQILKA